MYQVDFMKDKKIDIELVIELNDLDSEETQNMSISS